MTRNELHLVAQRKQFFADGVNQGGMIAARKVGPPDGSGKKHIANSCEPCITMKEHNVAGGMAGAVDHLQRLLSKGHDITIIQPAIGHEGVNRRKTVSAGLLREVLQKK